MTGVLGRKMQTRKGKGHVKTEGKVGMMLL